MGFPGAGKTTVAEIIAKITGAEHLSSDKIRLELFPSPTFNDFEHDSLYKELDRRTKQMLEERKSVIYDANLNRFAHRKEKYDICEKVGATPVLIWVQTPREVAKQRALHESRARLVPDDESLESMFERISGIIEQPDSSEKPIIIEGVNVTESVVRRKLSLQ